MAGATRSGRGGPPTGETAEQELRRLRREFETLRQEQAFAKNCPVRYPRTIC